MPAHVLARHLEGPLSIVWQVEPLDEKTLFFLGGGLGHLGLNCTIYARDLRTNNVIAGLRCEP
jgi:hypothetical protein